MNLKFDLYRMFVSAEPDLWFSTDEEKGEYFYIYFDSIMVVGGGVCIV